jgi:hypothetical protein
MRLLKKAQPGIYIRRGYVDPWGRAFDLECDLIHARFLKFTFRRLFECGRWICEPTLAGVHSHAAQGG